MEVLLQASPSFEFESCSSEFRSRSPSAKCRPPSHLSPGGVPNTFRLSNRRHFGSCFARLRIIKLPVEWKNRRQWRMHRDR